MNRKRTRLIAACAVLITAVSPLYSGGCKDERRHSTASALNLPEAPPPLPANAAPAEVARAFLDSIRDAQHARERGFGRIEQKQKYESAMATLRSLAASRAIYEQVSGGRLATVPKDISEEAAVTLALESWVSLVAHYADGFLLDTITVAMPKPENSRPIATVRLEAERPEDPARLRQLEQAAPSAAPKTSTGEPSAPASNDALRARGVTLRPPLNVPIRAAIDITLLNNAGSWRVTGMRLGPGPMPQPPAAAAPLLPATTAPAVPPAPAT
jgi:hypothetical protein